MCLLPILVFGVTFISLGNVCFMHFWSTFTPLILSHRNLFCCVDSSQDILYRCNINRCASYEMRWARAWISTQKCTQNVAGVFWCGKAGRWNVCHHYVQYEIKFEWLRQRNKQIQFKRCKFSTLMHWVPFGWISDQNVNFKWCHYLLRKLILKWESFPTES